MLRLCSDTLKLGPSMLTLGSGMLTLSSGESSSCSRLQTKMELAKGKINPKSQGICGGGIWGYGVSILRSKE